MTGVANVDLRNVHKLREAFLAYKPPPPSLTVCLAHITLQEIWFLFEIIISQ